MPRPQPETVPIAEPVKHGFGRLPCPRCSASATITIDLDCFEEEAALHCCSCEENFRLTDIREIIAAWVRVMEWLDTAPLQ